MRTLLKYISFVLLFLVAELIFSCSGNIPLGKRPDLFTSTDSITVIKYSESELKIISNLDSIFACRVKETCFNGSVLIARQGRVLYKKAMGYSDFENKKMLNVNSAFQLASASKPFTATAILMLKEQGRLSLDDTIQKFIPDFPYKKVTIRLLLCHRSGLPNYMYFAEKYFTNSKKLISNADIVNCMITNKPARDNAPNKKFQYCNTNYCLLAYIVELVTKKTFAAYMKENIFDPLRMKRTWILDRTNDTIYYNTTKGYNKKKDDNGKNWEPAEVNFLDGVNGDKNVYSSVYDMFIFDRALYSGKLLKKETLEEAYKGYSHEQPGTRNYGLGWRIIDRGKGWKLVYHNGWWHGYNTLFFRRPIDETLIVILSNHYNRSTYHIQDIQAVLDNNCSDIDLEKEE